MKGREVESKEGSKGASGWASNPRMGQAPDPEGASRPGGMSGERNADRTFASDPLQARQRAKRFLGLAPNKSPAARRST